MIKLNTGFSRKVGEPNYGSRGASVNLELEVESTAIRDPERMQEKIRALFNLARRAVDEELRNGNGSADRSDSRSRAPASDRGGQDNSTCSECGGNIRSSKVVKFSTERYGSPVCYRCQKQLGDNGRG